MLEWVISNMSSTAGCQSKGSVEKSIDAIAEGKVSFLVMSLQKHKLRIFSKYNPSRYQLTKD